MDVNMASGPDFTLAVTINGTAAGAGTGEIQSAQWTITPGAGTLEVTISQSGKPDIVQSLTANGSTPIPTGYFLKWNPKGAWQWDSVRNGATFSTRWIGTAQAKKV